MSSYRESRIRRNTPASGRKFSGLPLLIIIGVIFVWFIFSVKSVGSTRIDAGRYQIEKGTTINSLPEVLDIDVSSWKYKLWKRFFLDTVPVIQVGTYEVDQIITLNTFLENTLKNPVHTDLTITILPGWNIYDIDDALARKGVIQPGEIVESARIFFPEFQKEYSFLKGVPSLEGFLYPDTYRISPSSDAKKIIHVLLSEFQKKIGDTYMTTDNAYQKLILASIVEREERDTAEKATVAGILEKRVKEGIAMGADATVCYEYAKTQKQCTPEYIASVIHTPSSYNTRAKRGYPPTPIAAPSLETWNATLSPKSSPYYYYLHDSKGNIHYATTLQEHNVNKAKYIQ